MFNRSNKCFLLSQFLSTVGDGCFHFALVQLAWSVGRQQGSFVGWSQLARTLPYFVAIFLAIFVIDRVRRRLVMRVSDILRFGGLLVLAYLQQSGFFEGDSITLFLYFGLIVLKSICDVHFQSAREAWVAQIEEGPDRIKLNSLVQGGSHIGFASGLTLAGLVCVFENDLVGFTGWSIVPIILMFDAFSYLFSFVLLRFTDNPDIPQGDFGNTGLTEIKKVFSKVPYLKTLLIITAIDNFFIMGPAFVSAPMLIQSEMGFSMKRFAFYEVFFSLAMFVASFLIYKKPPKKLLTVLSWGMILDGATHIPFIWCHDQGDYTLLLGLAMIHALCIPVLTVPRITWIQNNVPKEMQGRVFALMASMVLGVTGLSCAFIGFMTDSQWLPSESFCYMGYGAVIVGVFSLYLFRNADSSSREQ